MSRTELSRVQRCGLVVLALLSVSDLLTPLLTDGEHPPMAVAAAAAVLGVACLALVVAAWRGARRAVLPLAGLRALSAFAAVPAITSPGVPQAAELLAGAVILVTIAGIGLVLAPRLTARAR